MSGTVIITTKINTSLNVSFKCKLCQVQRIYYLRLGFFFFSIIIVKRWEFSKWFICLLVHLLFIVHIGSATIKEEIGELIVYCGNKRIISYPKFKILLSVVSPWFYIKNFFTVFQWIFHLSFLLNHCSYTYVDMIGCMMIYITSFLYI